MSKPTLVALRGGEGTGNDDARLAKVYALLAELAESLDSGEVIEDVAIVLVSSNGASFRALDYKNSLRMGGALSKAMHEHNERCR